MASDVYNLCGDSAYKLPSGNYLVAFTAMSAALDERNATRPRTSLAWEIDADGVPPGADPAEAPIVLDEFEREQGEGAVPVRRILEAFLAPVLRHILSGEMSEHLFGKFMGRLIGERGYSLPQSVRPLFAVMAGRFSGALRKAVPELSEEGALWRMHFSFGVMSNTLTHGDTLRQISGGRSGEPTMELLFDQIIEFCAAGIDGAGRRRHE